MPRFSVYPQGASVSVPQATRKGGGLRSTIKGWSPGAAARHRAWLQSIDPDELPSEHAYAFTLTLKETPSDSAEWHSMRRAWEKRVKRIGAIAGHWVTEWQRRGTPHLHGSIWTEKALDPLERYALIKAWLEVCSQRGLTATPTAQTVKDVESMGGWSRYCSKHSARSTAHAQRQGFPEGWETSGRVWGHWGGPWAVRGDSFDVDWPAWHTVRRVMRSWALADARGERDPARRKARMLAVRRSASRVSDPKLSRVLPVREWMPEESTRRLLDWLVDQGHVIGLPSEPPAPKEIIPSADKASSVWRELPPAGEDNSLPGM